MKRLLRSRDKKLCGVCGGFAEYFNIDPTLVRVIYILATLFTFGIVGVIAYFICVALIPEDDGIIG
jgi:phage shock protein C